MEMGTSPLPDPHDNDVDFELDDQRQHSIEDNSMNDDNPDNMETGQEYNDEMLYENEDELIDFDQDLPMDPDQISYMQDPDVDHVNNDQLTRIDSHDRLIRDASFEDAAVEQNVFNNEEDENQGNNLQEEATNIDINTEPIQPMNLPQDTGNTSTTQSAAETTVAANADDNLVETQESDVKDFAEHGMTAQSQAEEPEQHVQQLDESHLAPSVENAEAEEASVQVSKDIEAFANELDQSTENAEDGAPASEVEQAQRSPPREASPIVLHPVTIRYHGEDCWLFPPLENTDSRHVFLDDVALASEPFDRLLAALRTGLINDQEMEDHDELVFDIPVLGLHICEDSKHASLMNLSRIIDIYMMLSQNEGLTVFEPLFCELSTRVCLADQFAYIDEAAFVRRITYTDFAAEQAGSPEQVAEDHHEESFDAGEPILHGDEQPHTETSTYFDASGDHGDGIETLEREPFSDETGLEAPEEFSANVAEDSDVIERSSETQTTAFQEASDAENARVETPQPQRASPGSNQAESEEGTVPADTLDDQKAMRRLSTQHDETLNVTVQEEDSKAISNEFPAEDELEADEDLFAEDDAAELEIPDDATHGTEQLKQIDEHEVEPENIPNIEAEELDFDTWSDDEQETTKNEAGSDSLTTPSKGVNGKRKLLEEDDDFLDLDISTPEPKRTRQS